MNFDAVAQETVADVFADLGRAAMAVPSDGAPFAVIVLRDGVPESSQFSSSRTRVERLVMKVQVAEWALPIKGDLIEVLGEYREIKDIEHADKMRLVWRLETVAV